MKVLLTGCAGFIGMHVCERLLGRGDEVIGIDNLNGYYDPSLKEARLERLLALPGFRFERIDIAEHGTLDRVFEAHRPQRVIHLAAQAGVRYSLQNPQAYVASNLTGFVNVLEACRHHSTGHLVYASSSSVYGHNADLPFRVDQDVDHPVSLYAATKKSNELMAHCYSHLFRLPTTGLRFFTVYGPWGRPDMALWLFTQAIIEGRPIDVFNDGRMRRDFTYIDDIVEGVVRVLDQVAAPEPGYDRRAPNPAASDAPYRLYNIGNNDPVGLLDFIAAIENALGRKAVRNLLPMQAGDVEATYADVSALDRAVGFKPATPIDVGVQRFVEWYRTLESALSGTLPPAMQGRTVAVVGLGYVGLPLALAFGNRMPTIGFDIAAARVDECTRGFDHTGEASADDFAAARLARYTTDPAHLRAADFIVVAVPTPVDAAHQPDFGPLAGACRSVGAHLKPGAIVVFESTVYPGATEEVCIPLLEQVSGGRWKVDFFVGYSPERINPGDREHTLARIVKVVSGDAPATLDAVAALYEVVVDAGVHRAPSIAVAEAAKVIENTQRDLNIALMNELSLIFHRLGLDTRDVLAAAATKWNFLPFRPGLVGGHCIGVDPYYLTYKAETVGYHPQVILAGRRINDGMGAWVAAQTVKQLIAAGSAVRGAKVNVLGLTFKEDVPDLRNSKVIDVIRELESFGVEVFCHDPVASGDQAKHEYGVTLHAWDALPRAEAVVVAVSHRAFLERPLADWRARLIDGGAFIDVKTAFDRAALAAQGWRVWRL